MPRDGSVVPSDIPDANLSPASERCARCGRYSVERLIGETWRCSADRAARRRSRPVRRVEAQGLHDRCQAY